MQQSPQSELITQTSNLGIYLWHNHPSIMPLAFMTFSPKEGVALTFLRSLTTAGSMAVGRAGAALAASLGIGIVPPALSVSARPSSG